VKKFILDLKNDLGDLGEEYSYTIVPHNKKPHQIHFPADEYPLWLTIYRLSNILGYSNNAALTSYLYSRLNGYRAQHIVDQVKSTIEKHKEND
jgi:hypothetical protein